MKFGIMICGTALLFGMLTGCAKIPEKLDSPMLKVEPVIKDNKALFNLKLNTGLQNENGDTALVSIKGNIVFVDPGNKNARVLALPFELPVILPFDMGIIEIDKDFSESEIIPLVKLLGSDRERLLKEKMMERSFSDDRHIKLEITRCGKEKILDILREKINEKI